MRNATLSPLILQSTLGPFPSIGSIGSATPLDIYNPNNTAMLIDQIRFSFDDTAAPGALYLAAISVDLALGSIPITRNFVTLGALCPRYFGFNSVTPPANQLAPDTVFVYHLPRPLYVPPMVQLTARAMRQPLYTNDPGDGVIGNLRMTVVGRSLPANYPIPGSIEIPWVTETRCNEDTTRFVSGDGDMVNSNNVPLEVTGFVGINVLHANEATKEDMTVQMSLSNGTLLIRDQIPFFLAFPSDRGLLSVNARLQPGEFVRTELEIAASPDGAELSPNCAFTAIAMHGYRSIQTPGTLG